MSEEDHIRELVAAIEDGDEGTIREVLADEVKEFGGEHELPQDRVVESMLTLNRSLAGMEYTIEDLWHDDGTYVLHLGLTGTFEEPFEFRTGPEEEPVTAEPTGEEVSGSFVYLLRFDDDGDLEEMVGYDDSQAMRQMGVLEYAPDVEAAAEADD
jgi:hypothetical protein